MRKKVVILKKDGKIYDIKDVQVTYILVKRKFDLQ